MDQGKQQTKQKNTRNGPIERFFILSRITTLIKDAVILAVAFYLVRFIAEIIYYQNSDHRLLLLTGQIAGMAYGVASSLLVYAIAMIVDQYRKEK